MTSIRLPIAAFGYAVICFLLTLVITAGGLGRRTASVAAAETASGMSEMEQAPVASDGWYFAVSGDSRDCGDLIMPKIARSIADRQATAPVRFYWHLGDFRAIYRADCDIIKRTNPAFQCPSTAAASSEYIKSAWTDFIEHQVAAFGKTPVFLGIGNHELYGNLTRYQYRKTFRRWLAQPVLEKQRAKDAAAGNVYQPGNTYYHFIKRGVDFIYLDNADDGGFYEEQLQWLSKVLQTASQNASVKTIIVGMHAALPFSKSSGHAMDKACASLCSGKRAYEMLRGVQKLDGPETSRKHVYVIASHSHQFLEDIYNTPELKGKVLPGWIVGTAGAEQYTQTIHYGYLQVKVKPDGSVEPSFVEVTRDSPPNASGPGGKEITSFCFEKNRRDSIDIRAKGCSCGDSQ